MELKNAPDIKREILRLARRLNFFHVQKQRIFCFRSSGSKSAARARIWSLPRIWQQALKVKPAYCLEVLSERFDHLDGDQKEKVLLHELLHIPRNFSGSLLPHRKRRGERFERLVERLFQKIKRIA